MEPHGADVATMVRRNLRANNINLVGHLDPAPLHAEVVALPASSWNRPAWRTRMPNSPHREASDVLLRFQDMAAIMEQRRIPKVIVMGGTGAFEEAQRAVDPNDVLDTIAYPAWWQLDHCRRAVYDLARRWHATRIGRVVVTSLAPGKQIHPHKDVGLCAQYYDRFQVMIETNERVRFHAGTRAEVFLPGDVFWFDNTQEHFVVNHGETTRIAMIIDLKVEDYGDGWRVPERGRHRALEAGAGAG